VVDANVLFVFYEGVWWSTFGAYSLLR